MQSEKQLYEQLQKQIRELKDKLEPLQRNEQRFANAINATSDAIWEWDLVTNKTYYSPRWYEMLGYDNEELDMSFDAWAAICHPEDLTPTVKAIQFCMDNRQSYSTDFRIKTKNNDWKWIRGRGNIVKYDEDNKPILLSGTNTDISERKKMEEELQHQNEHLDLLVKERTEELAATNEELVASNEELNRINEQLNHQKEQLEVTLKKLKDAQEYMIQSEKMASLGMLAAGVAHEINNPLNFIQGSISVLDKYFNQHLPEHIPKIKPLIDNINIGVKRSVAIVKSLSHYSRSGILEVAETDIHQIIDDCLAMLNNEMKYKTKVTKFYTDKPYKLYSNEGKLHQVFLNILVNANQAISKDGVVSIQTQIQDQNIEIIICDNGSGIAKEHLNKIFDPFFTTKETGKGTGLGLSISYKIIEEHNGTIEYESEQNIGTKVKITLPLA